MILNILRWTVGVAVLLCGLSAAGNARYVDKQIQQCQPQQVCHPTQTVVQQCAPTQVCQQVAYQTQQCVVQQQCNVIMQSVPRCFPQTQCFGNRCQTFQNCVNVQIPQQYCQPRQVCQPTTAYRQVCNTVQKCQPRTATTQQCKTEQQCKTVTQQVWEPDGVPKTTAVPVNSTPTINSGVTTATKTLPLSIYNPTSTYMAQMSSKVKQVIPAANSSAGFNYTAQAASLKAQNQPPLGLGYCTDYARKIYQEVNGKTLPISGDAGDWYRNAQQKGLITLPASEASRVPPGSIAVWTGGGAGHVAVVESNDPNSKSMKVSEANWGPALNSDPNSYENRNVITKNFDVVSEHQFQYNNSSDLNRSGGTYTLVGFILPQ